MDVAMMRTIMTAVPELEEMTDRKVEALWGACNQFFDWEKRAMLQGTPSEQDKADHSAVLNWLTTIVKLAAKVNPQNEELEMILFRLDGSRSMFHSAMSVAEADAVLAKAFPE
jgi:hypothetical protein